MCIRDRHCLVSVPNWADCSTQSEATGDFISCSKVINSAYKKRDEVNLTLHDIWHSSPRLSAAQVFIIFRYLGCWWLQIDRGIGPQVEVAGSWVAALVTPRFLNFNIFVSSLSNWHNTMVVLLYFRTFKIRTSLEVKCEIYSCVLEPHSTD